MRLVFIDNDVTLTTTVVEPNEDTMLPPVAMVGQYAFLFHEMVWSKEADEWVAIYQSTQPLVLPASQGVNAHYMLRQSLKGSPQ